MFNKCKNSLFVNHNGNSLSEKDEKNVLEKLSVVPVFLYVNLKLKEASD